MQDGRSPTVEAAYARNPSWWDENGGLDGSGFDVDGFDSRGWNSEGVDRARRSRSGYAPDAAGARTRWSDARKAGEELLTKLDRRIPRSVSMRVTKAVAGLLASSFPGAEPPDGPEIVEGFNAVREPYAGAYWRPAGGQQEFFTVIVEQNPVNQRGLDPRNTWSATVMWQDAFGEGEDRILGKASLHGLVSAVSERLSGFRPGRVRHVVFMEKADTDAVSFGAMPVDDFAELDSDGNPPGDWISEVLALNPADALMEFRSKNRRSPGFEAMIERGLAGYREGSALRRVEPLL